jgi:hypothetical protein
VAGSTQNNSTLYKIDLGGDGNPILDIQPHELNTTNVLVGENISWASSFSNIDGSEGVFNKGSLTGIGTNNININNLEPALSI